MKWLKVAVPAALAAVVGFVAAHADVNYTPGSGVVFFTFTCFSTKACPAHTPIDTAGATLVGAAGSPTTNAETVQPITVGNGTAANAARVTLSTDGTGVVQANAGTNLNTSLLATSANQTNGNQIVQANAGTNLNTSALATSANQTTNATIGSTTSGQTGTLVQCAVTTGPPTYTTAQTDPLSCDTAGNVRAVATPGAALTTLTGWTSATGGNTTQSLYSTGGWPAVLLQLDQTSTISGGVVTIEGSFDGTNWVTIPVAQTLNPNTLAPLTNPYTLVASTNQPFLILTQGYQATRIRLSTVITGSATVTPFVTLLSTNPVISSLLNPLAAGSAVIGKVGVDQTTPGNTNAVQSIAGATGGATVTSALAPATPAGVNLKASAGTLYSIQATTIQSTPVYVKFYNSGSAPTCGSGTPVARFMVPAASTAANGAGTNIQFPVGVAFGTGIGYCVTGALPDADTTAITVNNTLVNIEWN